MFRIRSDEPSGVSQKIPAYLKDQLIIYTYASAMQVYAYKIFGMPIKSLIAAMIKCLKESGVNLKSIVSETSMKEEPLISTSNF